MNPADCYDELWRHATSELSCASKCPNAGGVVRYASASAYGVLEKDEGGFYSWGNGQPLIRIFRDARASIPEGDEPQRPTELSDAIAEAVILAHEVGHFRSDRDGSNTQTAYCRIGTCDLTSEDFSTIMNEERSAWQNGRAELLRLGVSDWAVFDRIEKEKLSGYSEGLRGCLEGAPQKRP